MPKAKAFTAAILTCPGNVFLTQNWFWTFSKDT